MQKIDQSTRFKNTTKKPTLAVTGLLLIRLGHWQGIKFA
jgi:hypothetical protein